MNFIKLKAIRTAVLNVKASIIQLALSKDESAFERLYKDDVLKRRDYILNPEYLITVTKRTHDAIHYGDKELLLSTSPITRTKNDTCPWRH